MVPVVVVKVAIVEGPCDVRVCPPPTDRKVGISPTPEPATTEGVRVPVSQDVVFRLTMMWMAVPDLKPGHTVEVTVVDKPPTEPDLVKSRDPKGTAKVRPAVVPEGVPEGVKVEFNSQDFFASLPEDLTA